MKHTVWIRLDGEPVTWRWKLRWWLVTIPQRIWRRPQHFTDDEGREWTRYR